MSLLSSFPATLAPGLFAGGDDLLLSEEDDVADDAPPLMMRCFFDAGPVDVAAATGVDVVFCCDEAPFLLPASASASAALFSPLSSPESCCCALWSPRSFVFLLLLLLRFVGSSASASSSEPLLSWPRTAAAARRFLLSSTERGMLRMAAIVTASKGWPLLPLSILALVISISQSSKALSERDNDSRGEKCAAKLIIPDQRSVSFASSQAVD